MRNLCCWFFFVIGVLEVAGQSEPLVVQTKNTNSLIPEGIAVDPVTGNVFVTSIAHEKIIVIDKDGTHRDFIASGANGFGQGLGIKIDSKNKLVWAVSNKQEGKWFISQVHAFDIKTGNKKYHLLLRDTISHFFNDLVIDKHGNAIITATMSGKLFSANPRTGKLAVFLNDSLLKYPNGIVLHDKKLYVATYGHGLLIYDMTEKKLKKLEGIGNKTYAYNLDGLDFYKNSLLGVYNTDSLNANNAIIAYQLDKKGTKVFKEQIVAKGHPLFKEPTTIAISGNKLFVLANSHLAAYNANKESLDGIEKKLTPVTILIYDLYQ